MNEDIKLMMKIYGTYEYDWLGDPFESESELTRHHIEKRENGGENDISNYALLTKKSHIFLHYLEDNYNKEYVYLNKMFLSLNRSVSPPDREYYERVNKVVKSVKKRIKNKKNHKNKILTKRR